jgi:fatty acid desaturase
MKRSDRRIVWASIGVFIWLGGLYATICGLLYDVAREYRWGMLALIVGVATFVIALNPFAQRGARDGDQAEKM